MIKEDWKKKVPTSIVIKHIKQWINFFKTYDNIKRKW